MPDATPTRRASALAWFLAIAGLAGIAWFSRVVYPLAFAADRLCLPLFLAALTLLGAIGWGAVLRPARDLEERRSVVVARFLIVGLPIYGTLAFLLGTITTAPTVVGLLLAASAILGVVSIVRIPRVPAFPSGRSSFTPLLLVAGGAAAMQLFAIAQLPAFSLDEVAYHLTVLMQGVIQGRIVEQPLLSHSYFPFGSEAASLPILALMQHRGAIGSHFVALALATAVLLFAYHVVRERAGARAAAVATACLLATPAMLVTAAWTWTDWPLLGIVLVMFDAIDRDEVEARFLGLALAAGLLTKYTFVVPALALLVARIVSVRAIERRVARAILFGGLTGSVFYLRNLLLTGNPFAPMFGHLAPDVTMFRNAYGLATVIRSYIFDARMQDEALGIALFLLAVGGLAGIATSGRLRTIFITAVAGTAGLALLLPSSRILVPTLAIVAITGAISLFTSAGPRSSAAAAALLFTCALAQMFAATLYLDSLGAFPVLTGHSSEEAYLRQVPGYEDSRWATNLLPENAKTLVIGLNTLFWFDRPVRGGGNFDGPRMNALLESHDAVTIYRDLRHDGITHVAIFDRGLSHWQDGKRERATTLSPNAEKNMRELIFRYANRVSEDGDRHLYALK